MYNNAADLGINPQNTMPVATVGGEPGGRAAVVVDDVHAAADGGQEQGTSTVIGGQAEPGRNVFEKPVEGVKSAGVPVAGGDAEGEVGGEPKVISVIAQQQQVQQPKEGDNGDKAVKVEIKEQKKTEEQTATDSQARVPGGGGGGKPVGPLAEAEAEAEKVAQELYPDAA
jgi:dolichyl-phosphate-mannose-protein mannosyltransferase